jgi:hypothetical protein
MFEIALKIEFLSIEKKKKKKKEKKKTFLSFFQNIVLVSFCWGRKKKRIKNLL